MGHIKNSDLIQEVFKMRNRKAAALGCTALLITVMMTGCAAKGNDSLAATSQVSESTARTTTENTQNGKTEFKRK